jgi:hypothetical protein
MPNYTNYMAGSDKVEMAFLLRLHEAVYKDPPRIEHGLCHYFIGPMTY